MSEFQGKPESRKPAPGMPAKRLSGKKRFLKGSVQLAPVPAVLVTCADGETSDIVTVGWTGIVCTHPPMTYISIRPERYSYPLITQSGEFVINLTTKQLVKAVDFCGVRSGKDVDKFEVCKLTPEPCSKVSCPMLAESPLSLECKVVKELPLGTHNMLLAEIVAINVDEKLLAADGKLRLDKADLLAFAHGEYYELGQRLGSFGYSVKKPVKKSRGKAKPKSTPDKRRNSK